MTDIILIKLDYKHTRIFARTEDRWFEITGCHPDFDFSGVLQRAKEVSAQYVADLYSKSIRAKASRMKRLRKEETIDTAG